MVQQPTGRKLAQRSNLGIQERSCGIKQKAIHTVRQRLRQCQFFLNESNGFYLWQQMNHCNMDLCGEVILTLSLTYRVNRP